MKDLRTKTWRVTYFFDRIVKGEDVLFSSSDLCSPCGVSDEIRINWDSQLEKKSMALSKGDVITKIKPYIEGGANDPLNALYKNDMPIMWPGHVLSLKDVHYINDRLELVVAQTSFPFILGINDPMIIKLYEKENISLPLPAIGICTYAITTDGKIVLTRRGEQTNMYPGRIHGEGGNPESTFVSVIDHQVDEMEDEILVRPDDYDINSFKFGGIIEDTEDLPRKPNLIGWVPVNLSSTEIKERIDLRPKHKRPNDVVDIVFAPSDEKGLFNFLTKETIPTDFTPEGNGGLVLYGAHNFGRDWADEVVKRMNT